MTFTLYCIYLLHLVMRLSFIPGTRWKWPILLFVFSACSLACGDNKDPGTQDKGETVHKKKEIKRLPGNSQAIPSDEAEQGKVLIAYSDCFSCHAIDAKAKGPSFRDIAKRYPANEGYIELLARKIIVGGSGAWGYPVMTPHAEIPVEKASLMVKYILSLEGKKKINQ